MAYRICEVDADSPRKETDFDDRDTIRGHRSGHARLRIWIVLILRSRRPQIEIDLLSLIAAENLHSRCSIHLESWPLRRSDRARHSS